MCYNLFKLISTKFYFKSMYVTWDKMYYWPHHSKHLSPEVRDVCVHVTNAQG